MRPRSCPFGCLEGATVGVSSSFSAAAADPRYAGAGRLHRPQCRFPGAKRHLRVFPRPRRTLCKGPVPRAGFPGSGGAVALARLSARARHGGGIGRGRAAPLCGRPPRAARGAARRSFSRSSTAIRFPPRSAQQAWSEARAELARRLALVGLHPPKRAIRHLRAVGGNLFQSDADPREAARQRIPDHSQLSAGHALQHP